MAASLTVIDFAGTPITTLKTALDAKGLVTSIQYEDADCLIFTTPLVPSKVLKIKIAANVFQVSYGDAWTSAETITNPVMFASRNQGSTTALYLIADTTWFFIGWESTNYLYQAYVGALDSGDVLVAGFSSNNNGTYGANNMAFNVTTGTQLLPVSLSSHVTFTDDAGKLLKMPLMWYNPADKKLKINGAAPAQTLGIYASSWKGGALNTDLGTNYYLSGDTSYQVYGSSSMVQAMTMALLVEFGV